MSASKSVKVNAASVQNKDNTIQAGSVSMVEGPLPDPETLKMYEQLHPGTIDILLSEFQKEGQARRETGKILAYSSLLAPVAGIFLVWAIGHYCVELAKVNANLGSYAIVVLAFAIVISILKDTFNKFKASREGIEIANKK